MKILAIDSSGLTASVAVLEDKKLIAEYTINYKKTHSQTLLPMIDEMMKMIDLKPAELDGIAVSAGPGSFTGLRIGVALAKGLGLGLDKPVATVSTIEGLAYNLYGHHEIICPILDARRNQVYTGIFCFDEISVSPSEYRLNTIMEPVPADMEELIDKINVIGKKVIFTGDGIPVYEKMISQKITVPYEFANLSCDRQRAASIGLLGLEKINAGKAERADEVKPVYLRLSQAERELMEKKGEF